MPRKPQFASKRQILIIDEDRATLDALGMVLKDAYAIHLAPNFHTAESILDHEAVDLIILNLVDLPLGRPTGFDFLARLRQNSAVPVLLVSSAGTKELLIAGLRARADDFIDKACTETHLLARVHALVGPGPPPEDVAERIRDFVEAHFPQDWTMESLAEALTLSVRTIRQVFSRRYHQSVLRFLEEVRLREARALLAGTDLPIQEVARRVGFRDPQYFGRVFRQRSSVSPRQFRVRQREATREEVSTSG